MGYLLRRIGHGLVLLGLLSTGCFLLADLAPGDFLSEMHLDPQISEQTMDTLRARYGLDQSFLSRYGYWLKSALQGDLGFSFANQRPVTELLLPRVRNTLLLTAVSTVAAWALALLFGTFAAARPNGLIDRLITPWSAGFQAVPEILLCLGALWIVATTGWFPAGGIVSLDFSELSATDRAIDFFQHLSLPALILAASAFPVLFGHVRSAVSDTLDKPFLRAARGHGISEWRRLFFYALPAAAHPLLPLLGLSIGGLLSESLIVEVMLGWPGLGPLLLDAIFARDLHVVVGATLMSSLFLLAGNLFTDLLLLAIDPRLRTLSEGIPASSEELQSCS